MQDSRAGRHQGVRVPGLKGLIRSKTGLVRLAFLGIAGHDEHEGPKRGSLLAALALAGGLAVLPVAPALAQQTGVEGTVWVADEYGDTLTVIDAATNQVVTRIAGIEGPHNLQVAPDGLSVWAVSGHDALAVMIDAATYSLHAAVPTGKGPAHIILTPDGRTAYVSNGDEDSVTAIDVETMQVVATIPVGAYPHGLRPSPDGRWVYVANARGTTVSVVDTESNTRAADIEVGNGPVQVGFSPNGQFVYVSLNGEDAVGKVDVATRTLAGTVPVGVGPIQVFVTPDGRYVLAANQGTSAAPSTTVSIIETAGLAVVATVESGPGAHGVVVEPSGRQAYITNIYGDEVAVLDIGEQTVTGKVPTGAGPNGISFSPLAPAPAPAPVIRLAVPHPDEEMPPACPAWATDERVVKWGRARIVPPFGVGKPHPQGGGGATVRPVPWNGK